MVVSTVGTSAADAAFVAAANRRRLSRGSMQPTQICRHVFCPPKPRSISALKISKPVESRAGHSQQGKICGPPCRGTKAEGFGPKYWYPSTVHLRRARPWSVGMRAGALGRQCGPTAAYFLECARSAIVRTWMYMTCLHHISRSLPVEVLFGTVFRDEQKFGTATQSYILPFPAVHFPRRTPPEARCFPFPLSYIRVSEPNGELARRSQLTVVPRITLHSCSPTGVSCGAQRSAERRSRRA